MIFRNFVIQRIQYRPGLPGERFRVSYCRPRRQHVVLGVRVLHRIGLAVPDEEHLRSLTEDGRVLLAITPDRPPSSWTAWAWTEPSPWNC
jgi:hypothetical protein